jgi:hypothetical protein
MFDTIDVKDRREHKRYLAKNHLFAVVRSEHHQLRRIDQLSKGEIAFAIIKSNPIKMGDIIEISRGGLSFNYIENKEKLSGFKELDIIFAEKDFHLKRLPFIAVEDAPLCDEGPLNALTMKRMTVQFKGLTTRQKDKIEHLISNFTIGEVPEIRSKQAWGCGYM